MLSRTSSRGCLPWSLRSSRAVRLLARWPGGRRRSFRRRLHGGAFRPSGRQVPPAPRGRRRRASGSAWAEERTFRCGHGFRARSSGVVSQASTAHGSVARRPACVVGDPAVGRQSRGPTPRPRRVRRTTRLSPRRTGPGCGPGARWRRCGHQERGRTLCRGSPRHDGRSQSQCRADPDRRHTAVEPCLPRSNRHGPSHSQPGERMRRITLAIIAVQRIVRTCQWRPPGRARPFR